MQSDAVLKFHDLVERVKACRQCPRMQTSARVLGPGCGPITASIMFVGEAPGRLGADGSELPFHGDKAGHNFERLIEQVGLSRYEMFVTNAVLCNPKDERGNNATPTTTEVENCAHFLRETIELVQPSVVVTLGAVALKSCSLVEGHKLTLREAVRTATPWLDRTLVPAYHPGQRAMLHRSFANQLSDYQFIVETLQRKKGSKRRASGKPRADSLKLTGVADRILSAKPDGLSYFALHKLCFLAEVAALEELGERMTNAYVVRQKDGPYFVDLHLRRLTQLLPRLRVVHASGRILLFAPRQLQLEGNDPESHSLSADEIALIDKVLAKYGSMPDAELKRVVYLSKYMRALLRRERLTGENLFNAAVLPFQTKGLG